MPRIAEQLEARAVSLIAKPGVHPVGGVVGLSLQVKPSGARSWLLRVMVGTKRREIGLGGYPSVPLALAREKARQAREKIERGIDPVQDRRAARSALLAAQAAAMTFEDCARACIKAKAPEWKSAKHAQQWTNTLEAYAYPVLGKMLVADVSKTHILSVLEPIWVKKNETASRLRSRIEIVLDFAAARGHRAEGLNPARWRGNLDKLLAKPSKVNGAEHHPALPVALAGAFLAELRRAEGIGAKALEFLVLTAARSGDVRGAKWSEIDLDAAVWTIPAGRMKAGKEHRVPLSQAALAVVEAMPRIEGSDLVFAAPRGGQLSDMTLAAVIKRMNAKSEKPRWIDPRSGAEVVPHGFRSTFRDWTAERTSYPGDLAEMALAHSIGNKVEAAYRRGDMFEKRRQMMDAWALFCATPEASGQVVPLKRRTA